ncbi:MAG: hypothetical protein WB438_01245 [Candidatus Cybelea sp.]
MMRKRIRYAQSYCVAAAMLAGCGGTQPPIGAPGPISQTSTVATHSDSGKSWMLPEAKSENLLYVSNSSGDVSIYRYQQRNLVGVLTGFMLPLGECVDKTGNVYIVDFRAQTISEYAHGGTEPIAAIDDSPYRPYGCAVDGRGGNLAIANYEEDYSGKGNVAVYVHATGSPAYYTATFSHYQSCAYDNEGNLLTTDGFASGSDFAWLPKNGKKLVNIEVKGGSSEEGGFAGVQSIVWDGKDFVIDTSLGGGSAIYRISIKNKRGRTVGTTYLGGSAGTLGQLAIYNGNSQGAQVVGGGGETSGSLVDYWKYPSGGSPFAQITNGLDGPFGVAISLKGRQ